jgi:hypothetical protein
MKTIPRHWAFAPTRLGYLVWRSSPISEADAKDIAQQAAECQSRFEQKEETGFDKYPYGVTLREKLLDEIYDTRKQLQGFITRNGVAAEVLNVRNVMFLDWDTPTSTILQTFFRWLRRLVFGDKSHKTDTMKSYFPDDQIAKHRKPNNAWETAPELAAFMAAVTQWSEWGVRMYKTCAGYRGLVTHATFDPTAESTLDLMRQFHCDPQYIVLCKRQESFRARLTPKKWRCKQLNKSLSPNFRFSYPGCDMTYWHGEASEADETQRVWDALEKYEQVYDNAVVAYEHAAAKYATCRYLGTVGNTAIHPDIASIVALHDEKTHALSEAEMALA